METFLAWKTKFDAEMAELKKEKILKEKTKGLTGKTRPKPVGHGNVFSMAVSSILECLKLVPFFVRGRTVDSEGGRGCVGFFKNEYPGR